MPLATMASADSRITLSLTLHAKWFQLFQPIGGVRARPVSCADADTGAPPTMRTAAKAMPRQREMVLISLPPSLGSAAIQSGRCDSLFAVDFTAMTDLYDLDHS